MCPAGVPGILQWGRRASNMNWDRTSTALQVASVGRRLRQLRKERGLTQSDLARQIGIQQSDLSRMEKGEYRVSLDNLVKILAVFGIDLAAFFAGEERARPTAALSQDDMQLLQTLRQLSVEARREVREYAEFKLRRQRIDGRIEGSSDQAEKGRG